VPELVVQSAFGERLFLDYMGDFLFLVSDLAKYYTNALARS
jgi:hypothetical protein